DRVHLLRLDQLAFERSLLADVGDRAGELDRMPLRVLEQHRLIEDVLEGPVGALPAVLERHLARFAPCFERRDDLDPVVGMKPLDPHLPFARRFASSNACSCRALCSTSFDFSNSSTNTATLDLRITGSTGLNT